jgi:hypothetical protein
VILVAIVGNAAEHSTAVVMAWKNQADLAVGIAMGSALQIALFVAPVLMFASYLRKQPMDLLFSPMEAAAVILAKSAQTMAQAVFITAGLCLVGTRLAPAMGRGALVFGSVAVALAAALILLHRKSGRGGFRGSARANASIRAVATRLRDGIRGQPGRLALSVLMFALAYAWGAFEAYWICWFLGHPVSLATAAMIEVLSITVDGLLFVVPAKIGTQEGGKMAVFGMLGLSTSLGLAFGIVRHVRELTWAGLGLLLCVPHARGRWSGAARAPGPTAPTS